MTDNQKLKIVIGSHTIGLNHVFLEYEC